MITVLTPTYNRANLLEKAYDSLLKQNDTDFEWLIIDDGSKDDTFNIVNKWAKEKKIKIRYLYKENGGKHTALNLGFKNAKGEFLTILDSDDLLTPTAISTIKKYWNKYKKEKNIVSISFLRGTPDGKTIGKIYNGNEIISDNIDFRYNKGHLGDMAETYRTSILQKYSFPVFKGERFLSEAVVWNEISFKYKTVYINEIIYTCEYLDGGLSKNILKARYNNPLGCIENCKIFMNKRFKFSIRVKNAILYSGFAMIAKQKKDKFIYESGHPFLVTIFLPFGMMFKIYLKKLVKKNEKK